MVEFKCQELMRQAKADVVVIQESHLKQAHVTRMQNKQYMEASSSSNGSTSRGIFIMFKRTLPVTIEKSNNGKLGRIAHVRMSIYGTKIALISVYTPAVFEKDFYPDLTEDLLSLANC